MFAFINPGKLNIYRIHFKTYLCSITMTVWRIRIRKRLFAETLPSNKNKFAGTVPANKN